MVVMETGTGSHLVELDSRRRAALGRLARHDRYLVTEEPDGTLILTPAVVMTELEAKLLRDNPELVRTLESKMAHPERLTRRALPSN
jgi:prophage tail gpP-like protein